MSPTRYHIVCLHKIQHSCSIIQQLQNSCPQPHNFTAISEYILNISQLPLYIVGCIYYILPPVFITFNCNQLFDIHPRCLKLPYSHSLQTRRFSLTSDSNLTDLEFKLGPFCQFCFQTSQFYSYSFVVYILEICLAFDSQ